MSDLSSSGLVVVYEFESGRFPSPQLIRRESARVWEEKPEWDYDGDTTAVALDAGREENPHIIYVNPEEPRAIDRVISENIIISLLANFP